MTCEHVGLLSKGIKNTSLYLTEEKAHLQTLTQAGIIQTKVSDWASASMLIRKHDGQVRVCWLYGC